MGASHSPDEINFSREKKVTAMQNMQCFKGTEGKRKHLHADEGCY